MTLAANTSPAPAPPATQMGSFNSNASTIAQPAPQVIPQPPIFVTTLERVDSPTVSLGGALPPDPVFGLYENFQKLLRPAQDQAEPFDAVAAMANNDNVVALPSDAHKLWADITKILGAQPKSEAELLALLEKIKADQKAFEARLKALEAQMNAAPRFVEVTQEVPQDDIVIMAPVLSEGLDITMLPVEQDMADMLVVAELQPALPIMLDEFKTQITDMSAKAAPEEDVTPELEPKPEPELVGVAQPEAALEETAEANTVAKGRMISFKLNAVDTVVNDDPTDNKPQPIVKLQVAKPAIPTYRMVA